ncbi:D-alanyl-D-alanine carboxypeptidase family protein [Clostridium carnis]
MRKRNLLKSFAVALSISLVAPFASRVNAQETNITAPEIIGQSAITMDMDTGEVIYSKDADIKLSPASTTKLMTSLIFAENKSKSDTLTFTPDVIKVTETSLNNFKHFNPGDTISANDIMNAVMIYSANDAAYLMADSVAGSVDTFVKMMNEKALSLGLKNTKFENPSGLEIDPLNPSNTNTNLTTAHDLAIIAKEAFKNDWIRETISPKNSKATIDLKGSPFPIETRNKILGKNGNIGGKTGTETKAGHCFVGFYEKDGRDLVTVVLNSEYGADGLNVFHDTEKIADYSYNVQKDIYKKSGDEVGTIDLEYKIFRFFGPKKIITAPILLAEDVNYYKNDLNDKILSINYNDDTTNAWKVTSGKEVKLSLTVADSTKEIKGTVKLTSGDLFKANFAFYLAALLIIVVIGTLIIIIVKIINMKKRRRRRRRY